MRTPATTSSSPPGSSSPKAWSMTPPTSARPATAPALTDLTPAMWSMSSSPITSHPEPRNRAQFHHDQLVRGVRQDQHRRGGHRVALRRRRRSAAPVPGGSGGFPRCPRSAQTAFDRTGGLHAAAALFDGETGAMLVIREDIGRHNAVDKVVGWAVLNGRLPLHGAVLLVSGRAGFELSPRKPSWPGSHCSRRYRPLVAGRRIGRGRRAPSSASCAAIPWSPTADPTGSDRRQYRRRTRGRPARSGCGASGRP